jgi:hypothetical protein
MVDINYWEILSLYGQDLSDCELLYSREYHDWSWGDILIVYEKNGKFFVVDCPDTWSVREVSQEEALAEIMDFDEIAQ